MPVTRESPAEAPPANTRKRSALPWVIGCLIALVVLPVLVGIIGVLAAIAIPAFVTARDRAHIEMCLANVHKINRAKEIVAMEKGYTNGMPVTMADLAGELGGPEKLPACPKGGTYGVGRIGEVAGCSFHTPPIRQLPAGTPGPTPRTNAAAVPAEDVP